MPITAIDGAILFADTADAQTQLSPQVKAECERRILAIMPAWKQRNVIADLWSDDASIEAAAATEWAKITALRTKSNEIEASILSMTDTEIIAFDATDDAHWS
tara:strand:- start:291 stop:599 length:309 start_codon:yes stop_codon:yes gene_type:complete